MHGLYLGVKCDVSEFLAKHPGGAHMIGLAWVAMEHPFEARIQSDRALLTLRKLPSSKSRSIDSGHPSSSEVMSGPSRFAEVTKAGPRVVDCSFISYVLSLLPTFVLLVSVSSSLSGCWLGGWRSVGADAEPRRQPRLLTKYPGVNVMGLADDLIGVRVLCGATTTRSRITSL